MYFHLDAVKISKEEPILADQPTSLRAVTLSTQPSFLKGRCRTTGTAFEWPPNSDDFVVDELKCFLDCYSYATQLCKSRRVPLKQILDRCAIRN